MIGKFSNITENNNMKNHILKKISSRELKNGEYIIVANKSNPLVIEKNTLQELQKGNFCVLENADIYKTFDQSGFFTSCESLDANIEPIAENKNRFWKNMKLLLFGIGIVSIFLIIISFFYTGIPSGFVLIPNDIPIWITLIFIAVFYPLTALMHEFMHMLFGRTLTTKGGNLGFNISKNVAFVSLNHVWVWSFWSRIATFSAGIIFDLFLLAILLILQIVKGNWMFMTASSLLLYRILWQFQFQKNCDGRLLALNILDNPFIHIDAKDKNIETTKEIKIWKKLILIGYLIKIILILFWGFPIIFSIINYLKAFF